MASPDLRTAIRTGAAHLDRMAARLAEMERDGRVTDHVYAELLHQYEILGGYTLDLRVDTALTGLGFARDEWAKPPSALSGGEQTRASLARLVIADPDLLLLDEPTNHLDLDALEWLEDTSGAGNGSLLVASHDRAFLDATVTRVWELRDRRLTAFRGDYSAYHRQRVERDERNGQGCRDAGRADRPREGAGPALPEPPQVQQDARARGTPRNGSRRSVARPRRPDEKLAIPTAGLVGSGPSRSGEIAVRLEGVAVGLLPGRGAMAAGWVLPRPRPGSSRARRSWPPSAASGSGSSGPMARARRPCCGRSPATSRRWTARSRSATPSRSGISRSSAGAAIAGTTVLDALTEAIPLTAGEARSYLARFLFRGDDAFKEVRSLSGGERSRLELALLGIQPSNLLLLDEPTNHLDIPAREAIEAFMAGSPATLLVVSHDRRLLETVCEKLWVVGEGSAVPFDGGYREWRAAVASGWTVAGALEAEAKRLRGGWPAGRQSRTPPLPTAMLRDRLTGACGARPAGRLRGPWDDTTSIVWEEGWEEGEAVEGGVSAAEGVG